MEGRKVELIWEEPGRGSRRRVESGGGRAWGRRNAKDVTGARGGALGTERSGEGERK